MRAYEVRQLMSAAYLINSPCFVSIFALQITKIHGARFFAKAGDAA
jgi:hypothetical protein